MEEKRKECFGVLDKVFPIGQGDLREVPESCFACPVRKACLQAALKTGEGLKLREELVDRSAAGGILGGLMRWSQKKTLNRLMKERKS